MAINNSRKNKGFALIIAIIFTSVILSLGLSMGALGFKQMQLSSSAIQSQYALYAADAALECTLYADQQQDKFNFNLKVAGDIICDGNTQISKTILQSDGSAFVVKERLSLGAGQHCADVTIYKFPDYSARIFSQGYDVPCSVVSSGSARFVSRGLKSSY